MNQIKDKKLKTKDLRSTFYVLRSNKGFTLVEIIVAVGIFSIVMLISVGALLSVLEANRKAQNVKTLVNNVNLAVENVTREIRVGSSYRCTLSQSGIESAPEVPLDCVNGAALAFEPSGGTRGDSSDQVIIYLSEDGAIMKSDDGGQNYLALTAPGVEVTQFRVNVYGSDPSDGQQPRVLIRIVGGVHSEDQSAVGFNLQTTSTQRLLDG